MDPADKYTLCHRRRVGSNLAIKVRSFKRSFTRGTCAVFISSIKTGSPVPNMFASCWNSTQEMDQSDVSLADHGISNEEDYTKFNRMPRESSCDVLVLSLRHMFASAGLKIR